MSKPRLSEGHIPFQLGIDAPPALPYQGDAYIYDMTSGMGSVSGGTVLDGPNQNSPTGSIVGGTVLPGPSQDSPTGSITGGTVIDSEYTYD